MLFYINTLKRIKWSKNKTRIAPNEDDFGWYRFEFEISKHGGFRLLFIYCWQIKIKTARNPITQCVVVFDCQKKMHNIKGKNRPLSCASAPFFYLICLLLSNVRSSKLHLEKRCICSESATWFVPSPMTLVSNCRVWLINDLPSFDAIEKGCEQ